MGASNLSAFYRVTISDAIRSMVQIVNDADLRPTISRIRSEHEKLQLKFQPIIIVVGLSYHNLTGFYEVIDNNILKTKNFLDALDLCFKSFFVFNDLLNEVVTKLYEISFSVVSGLSDMGRSNQNTTSKLNWEKKTSYKCMHCIRNDHPNLNFYN
jgi:hypothetical protein